MGMQLIETVEIGASGSGSLVFTSIPQDGIDLIITLSLRQPNTGTFILGGFRLNNTGRDSSRRRIVGSGTSVTSDTSYFLSLNGSSSASNTFTNGTIHISNYASSSPKKVNVDWAAEDNASAAEAQLHGQIFSIAGVTSFTLDIGGTIGQYSTASIYKTTAD
jgi:hypothetical protein